MSLDAMRTPQVVAGTLYALAMSLVAGVAAWPIYRSPVFVIIVAGSVAAAFLIAAAARSHRWRAWIVVVASIAATFLIGMAVALVERWGGPAALPSAAADVLLGLLTGWKDLVTVQLPVGTYRNLLVLAIAVFVVGTLATALLAWRRAPVGAARAIPALGMVLFGLLFGRATTSTPLVVGALTISAPVELATGIAGLVLTLLWLAWRTQAERRAALRLAAETSGVRTSHRRTASDERRALLAGAMVAVAAIGGAAAAPAIASSAQREVLRTGVGPELAISRAVTPLAQYRSDFTDAQYSAVLFRVVPLEGGMPQRIRLATLSSYDGEQFRVGDPDAGVVDSRFTRVPSRRDGGTGNALTAHVQIEGLNGIWLPTFGSLEQVDFSGDRASVLADAFYYNVPTRSGVETAGTGLEAGDSYTLSAIETTTPALSQIDSPGAGVDLEAPKSLTTWIEQQHAGSDGAGLQVLVDRLRSRGYLSHALDEPADGSAWSVALQGYTFQPSAAGHSLARIDEMFRQLLDRESEAAAATSRTTSLVAAIGDDEQFAVATALIARQLGFPARVVLGARLTGADDGVAPCVHGVCTGGNLTAWVEVRSSAGEWVSVDVTPQHSEPIDTEVTRQRDPENPTEVRPESADEVVPPDPAQQDDGTTDDRDAASIDLSGLWAAARIVGVVLLALIIVAGPFLLIVVAKAARRRARRDAAGPATRIVGGWDEYVDAAVDHGLPAPGAETRSELAGLYATPGGSALAAAADRAVFSQERPSDEESEQFWAIVSRERRRLAEGSSVWRRLLAAVSLSSFTRNLAPGFPRSRTGGQRPTERRERPRSEDASSQ